MSENNFNGIFKKRFFAIFNSILRLNRDVPLCPINTAANVADYENVESDSFLTPKVYIVMPIKLSQVKVFQTGKHFYLT